MEYQKINGRLVPMMNSDVGEAIKDAKEAIASGKSKEEAIANAAKTWGLTEAEKEQLEEALAE